MRIVCKSLSNIYQNYAPSGEYPPCSVDEGCIAIHPHLTKDWDNRASWFAYDNETLHYCATFGIQPRHLMLPVIYTLDMYLYQT